MNTEKKSLSTITYTITSPLKNPKTFSRRPSIKIRVSSPFRLKHKHLDFPTTHNRTKSLPRRGLWTSALKLSLTKTQKRPPTKKKPWSTSSQTSSLHWLARRCHCLKRDSIYLRASRSSPTFRFALLTRIWASWTCIRLRICRSLKVMLRGSCRSTPEIS